MPRRKKSPPPTTQMDVDSDEDNAVTKQKKATEKFMALLKPIKDAALAFDVDVDEALEDYVEASEEIKLQAPFNLGSLVV